MNKLLNCIDKLAVGWLRKRNVSVILNILVEGGEITTLGAHRGKMTSAVCDNIFSGTVIKHRYGQKMDLVTGEWLEDE